jgi:hypothetical protein
MVPLNQRGAEQALVDYIESRFPAFQPSIQKQFSRLLFQHVQSPFIPVNHSGVRSIRVYGNFEFHINRYNINCPIVYHRRVRIKADAIYQSNHGTIGGIIIGEAKSSTDKTCFSPGSTFSCAHKIANDIVNERNQHLDSDKKGFLKAFLSQSLGYIDAVNQLNKISTMTYVIQLCPNSKIDGSFAQELYDLLPPQINAALSQLPNLLTLGTSQVEDINGVFYLLYDVNPIVIPLICEFMAEEFIERYLL